MNRWCMRWTPEEDAELTRLHTSGVPLEQIKNQMGRTRAGVNRRVYELKLPKHPYVAYRNVDMNRVREMLAAGARIMDIAVDQGVGYTTICNRMSEHGLKANNSKRPRDRMTDQEAKIVRLRQQYTNREVAAMLQTTKGVVAGVYWRWRKGRLRSISPAVGCEVHGARQGSGRALPG